MEQEETFNLDDLEFIKLLIPRLIPLHLVEAVKGKTFTPEMFYKFQEDQIQFKNPNNFLYALVDKAKKVVGYLWFIIDWDGTLYINTFSIDKNYWHKGQAIPKVTGFLKQFIEEKGIKHVLWATTNGRFFAKKGFKKSKIELMEFIA